MDPSVQPFGDPLCVIISRDEVEQQDTRAVLRVLRRLVEAPEVARANMEKVDIAFHGYDDDVRELFEIPEVRSYVQGLSQEFPYWLFFLSKSCLGLQAIALCMLPPFLTTEAQAEVFPQRLYDILERSWGPATNYVAEFAGVSDKERDALIERSIVYIKAGPLKVPRDN